MKTLLLCLVVAMVSYSASFKPSNFQTNPELTEGQTFRTPFLHTFPCKIIKKMSIPHCKKGPDVCKKCKKNTKEEWCLLNICPDKKGEVQRPVTAVKFHDKEYMKEYEVIQKFKSEVEAQAYSAANNIEIQK